jgi:uncharacterized membrane protein YeiH
MKGVYSVFIASRNPVSSLFAMKFDLLRLIDILGIISFAVSGVFAAMQKKLDIFGILVIAFITAVGGGTLRDILLGDLPVGWMLNLVYPALIVCVTFVTILFKKIVGNFQATLLVFDSLGLGFFTVIGLQKGITFELHPGICVALGTITGCFGGVIRDISLGTIPLIFQKEIYASASILGGISYFLLLLMPIPKHMVEVIVIAIIFVVRTVAVRFQLQLPSIY